MTTAIRHILPSLYFDNEFGQVFYGEAAACRGDTLLTGIEHGFAKWTCGGHGMGSSGSRLLCTEGFNAYVAWWVQPHGATPGATTEGLFAMAWHLQ
jgi:hypothetical protein